MRFAGIFIIIFVISASKYVGIVSFKLIGGKCFLDVYPGIFTQSWNQVFYAILAFIYFMNFHRVF